LFTKMKMAFSGESLIRFLITYTNCPTVKSAGTRYLRPTRQKEVRYWDYLTDRQGGVRAS